MKLALQAIVDQVSRLAKIAEYIADAIVEKLGHHRVITFGQRLERIFVYRVVEAENRTIETFPGIRVGVSAFELIVIFLRGRLRRPMPRA